LPNTLCGFLIFECLATRVGRSVGRNAERDPTGIRDKPIAPGSPWQNSFAERLIGSIRRECVDHVIALGEQHLRRVLKSYASYYNTARTQAHWTMMRRSRARFSASVASCRMPWSAGCITSMPESEFYGMARPLSAGPVDYRF
jgi:hypothetical protein